jgi:hypothetical protein
MKKDEDSSDFACSEEIKDIVPSLDDPGQFEDDLSHRMIFCDIEVKCGNTTFILTGINQSFEMAQGKDDSVNSYVSILMTSEQLMTALNYIQKLDSSSQPQIETRLSLGQLVVALCNGDNIIIKSFVAGEDGSTYNVTFQIDS